MARKLIVEVVGDSSSFERSLGRATGATRQFDRQFSSATRGVLSGSGVFRSLGRTLAFASGGFLAFGGGAAFIRKTIDAAKDMQVTDRQLAAQLRADGKDIRDWRGQIDQSASSLSALSGFDDSEIKAGLTAILRTTPDVAKALRDEATAADLARAKRIGLAQASTLLAKVEGGNATLLRRQGIQVAKNATVEEALASLRAKVAGQARAGTTEQERFAAILQNTEEIIGTGILPTLNKYLDEGSRWLRQMNESGKLQRDVASAAHDFEGAVGALADVVHTVDGITGSFKHTLELLVGIKIARWAVGIVGSFRLVGSTAAVEAGEVGLLRTALLGLGGPEVIAALAATYGAVKLIQNATKHTTNVPASFGPIVKPGETITRVEQDIAFLKSIGQTDSLLARTLVNLDQEMRKSGSVIATAGQVMAAQKRAADQLAGEVAITGGVGQHGALITNAQRRARDAAGNTTTSGAAGPNLTVAQRNTFFDNAIARILLRGGLGDIQAQIAALQRANSLLAARLKATKDVTRKLRLEDEILQNAAQIKSLQAEAAATALQARQDAVSEFIANLQLGVTKAQATKTFGDDIAALQALQAGIESEIAQTGKTADLASQLFDVRQQLAAARSSQISGRQFAALGLTATGDQRIPGVRALRRALGNVEDQVKGTILDTSKTQSLLSRIRKVLSGGLGAVGEDVRAKIQSILGDLNRQLDNSTSKNLTKWRHLSEQAFLAGIPDLTVAQKRLLEHRLSVISPNGTVPGKATKAFALAGGAATGTFTGDVIMDGEKVGRITKSVQITRGKKRTVPRAG